MKTKLTVKEINEKYIREKSKLDGFPPPTTTEDEITIQKFYSDHPELNRTKQVVGTGSTAYRVNEPWIQTYTGKRFSPTNPIPDSIVIEDIAHALSMICRYTGHSSKFYSVAEHSVLVSYLGDPKYGLLHDASEAYICDIASPIKKLPEFETYRYIERNLQKIIYNKFGLNNDMPESTKKADLLMLSTEAHYLMSDIKDWELDYKPLPFIPKCLSPYEAEQLFLLRYHELFDE